MLYLCVLLFALLFAGVAMTVGEGLWSNAVNLIAVVLSSLTAVAIGYPLGVFALAEVEKTPDLMWYFLLAGVWLVFFATIMALRLAAERLSRVRMRFVPPLEKIVGPLMGMFVAVMLSSFFAWTLLKIPIAAGEWDVNAASSWQKSTFQYLSAPFHTVGKCAFGDKEMAGGAFNE